MNVKTFSFILVAVLTVLTFSELIIFNEETQLALCFIYFVVFAQNSLGENIFSTFSDRGLKVEKGASEAFFNIYNSLVDLKGSMITVFVAEPFVYIFKEKLLSYKSILPA